MKKMIKALIRLAIVTLVLLIVASMGKELEVAVVVGMWIMVAVDFSVQLIIWILDKVEKRERIV